MLNVPKVPKVPKVKKVPKVQYYRPGQTMADQSILISAVLPASSMPLFECIIGIPKYWITYALKHLVAWRHFFLPRFCQNTGPSNVSLDGKKLTVGFKSDKRVNSQGAECTIVCSDFTPTGQTRMSMDVGSRCHIVGFQLWNYKKKVLLTFLDFIGPKSEPQL